MKKLLTVFSIFMFLVGLYVVLTGKFSDQDERIIPENLRGCYRSDFYGHFTLSDNKLSFDDKGPVEVSASLSYDNMGYFIRTNPSIDLYKIEGANSYSFHTSDKSLKTIRFDGNIDNNTSLHVKLNDGEKVIFTRLPCSR